MVQRYLSPGVFTREVDQSFLAQGVAGIGAVVIGRTLKGPAFVPTVVEGFDSFVERFGDVDPSMQMTYAAKNYLKNSSVLTVVRVLGSADGTSTVAGYSVGNITGISDAAVTGSILAILHASASVTIAGITGSATDFSVAIGSFIATASFVTSSANYIEKVLNTDPTKYETYKHYLAANFKYIVPSASASWTAVAVSGTVKDWLRDFSGGSTEWAKSQPVGGLDFNLFRFHTMPHGRATNDEFKVMIANVKPSASPLSTPYGSFDVVVRGFYDTDQRMQILDSFIGCNLDPTSQNYVARRIGDSYETFDNTQRKFIGVGDFPNKSKYIRIEMDVDGNAPAEALPWGHRGYDKLAFTPLNVIDDMTLQPNQLDKNGNIDQNICWGIMFASGSVADTGIASRMRAFPDSAVLGADTDFSLAFLSSSVTNNKLVWSYNASLGQSLYHEAIYASASLYKFNLPFIGGFDGLDLRVSNPLDLANGATTTNIGVVSLNRAADCVANPDAFDMNLIAVPGVHNLKVTDHVRAMVNDRMDAMFVMDITGSSVVGAVGLLKSRDVDDNYTACYYPDVKINDKTNNMNVRVSPSVAVLGAIAFSDRVGQSWFAPAGLNRGGLAQFDVYDVADRLNFTDRDTLYDNRINPIATFPNEGIVVFGQKTLQVKASALDRINVRRLLITAKKTIASAAKLLVFEPGNPTSWQRFLNAVNPILEKIRQGQGIERFKVVMDSTTNTPDVIDRNAMVGKIFLQPTKSAEFIDISFIITNAGVAFGE